MIILDNSSIVTDNHTRSQALGDPSSNRTPRLERRLSKSSEGINCEERRKSGGANNINFMNLDFDSKGIGGSLQKDLNVATQALEDVALESANVAKEVSKEVFNPLAKFTKGIQHFGDAVLNPNKKEKDFDDINPTEDPSGLSQQHYGASAHDHQVLMPSSSPNISRSGSNNAFQQDYMATKVSESSSCTQVLLL